LLNLQPEHAMLAPQKPKHTLLPVLVVLFLVSYGLMTMLVVEQGRTIDTQRNLIRELFRDTNALNSMRTHDIQHGQVGATPRTQAHAPLSQAPSIQTDPNQTHSGSAQERAGSKRNSQKFQRQAPQHPPKMTSDEADERRATNLI
jgi:hypothetical protein